MPSDLLPHYARLFEYDRWANREALASVASAAPTPPRSLALMAHIVAAEWLWLNRTRAEPQAMAVWPTLTLDECRAALDEVSARWRDQLAALTPERLGAVMEYTNTKGERWSSRVEDVLVHVVMHGAYHRAQIAADVRAAGHEPAYTDFIHAVRSGHIAPAAEKSTADSAD